MGSITKACFTPGALHFFTAMTEEFIIHNSIAEHYAAIGKHAGEEIEFAVHRLAALQRETPYASPLFRANFYSIVLIKAVTVSTLSIVTLSRFDRVRSSQSNRLLYRDRREKSRLYSNTGR